MIRNMDGTIIGVNSSADFELMFAEDTAKLKENVKSVMAKSAGWIALHDTFKGNHEQGFTIVMVYDEWITKA